MYVVYKAWFALTAMIGGTGIVPGNAPSSQQSPPEKDTFVIVKKSSNLKRLLVFLGVVMFVVFILLILVWRFGPTSSSAEVVGAPEAGAIRAGLRLVAEDASTLRKNFALRLAAYLNISVDCISLVTAQAANTGDYLDVVFDILPTDLSINRTCTTPNYTLEDIYDYLNANPGGIQLAGGATELKVRCSDGTFQAPPCIDPLDTAIQGAVPSAVITTFSLDPTSLSPLLFQVKFSRTVYWFVGGDVAVLSGDAAKVSDFRQLDGATYTFSVYPGASGLYTLQVLKASCQDRYKQYNTPSAEFTIVYNGGPPTLEMTTSRTPTNVIQVPIVATWSTNVTLFDSSDVVVSSSSTTTYTIASFTRDTASPNIYKFTVGPLAGTGNVTLKVAAGVAASYPAFTYNQDASYLFFAYDLVAPTVVLSASIPASVTNAPFSVLAQFSEAVTNFVLSAVSTTPTSGIVKANLIGRNSSVYSFDVIVSGSYSGAITLQALRGAATDLAINLNDPSNVLTVMFDNVPPSVTLVSTVGTLTGANPIPVLVQLSEPVATLPTISQLVLVGCTAANFTRLSTLVWSVEITPILEAITIDYAASLITDIAGNPNSAATQLAITWSPIAPTAVIASTTASPSPDTLIAVTMTFSEAVVDFTVASPSITGGSVVAGSVVDVLSDATKYSFNVRPSINGTVIIGLPAGSVHDDAGNGNLLASSLSIIHDAVRPYFTPSSSAAEPTNASPVPFTLTASESLASAISSSLFTITGGTLVAGSFSVSGLVATFTVTPAATYSPIIVSITANTINDLAGNGNDAFSFQRTYDVVLPVATFTSDAAFTQGSNLFARVTFSKAVQSFQASDLSITGAIVASFAVQASPPFTYLVQLTPSANADPFYQAVTVQLAAGAVVDFAGNGNAASAVFAMAFDKVSPTVVISSNAGDPYPLIPVPFIATFSEAVKGISLANLTVTGGVASNLVGGPIIYTFDVTPSITTGRILLVANIPAAMTTDLAGNSLIASNNFTLLFDTTVTIVSVTSSRATPGNVSPVPFVATFSKAVTGFSSSSIIIDGATLSNFTAISGGRIYLWDMTPIGGAAYANMTAHIVANAATDLLGVQNTASSVFVYIYDTVAPTFTIAFPTGVRTSPVNVVLTFSKPVTGFTSTDLVLSPGGLNNFAAVAGSGGAQYTFQVTLSSDATVTLSTAAAAVVDQAGNPSAALSQSFVFDSTAPVVTLTPAFSSPSNVIPVPFTATFSEPVNGFTIASLTVTNGILYDFAVVSNTTYTFTVNGTALRSHMAISVIAGGAYDVSLNPVALTTVQFISDRQPPVFVIRTGYPSPYNVRAIAVSAVFDEPVLGFSASALSAVLGGVISAFTVFNTSLYTFTLTANTAWVDMTISVAAGSCTDTALNPCPAFTFEHLNDQVAPNVTFTPDVSSPSFVVPLIYTATFSEAVTSFTASSLLVEGATVANVTMVTSSVFTFELTPNSTYVNIVINVPSGAVTDLATNPIAFTRVTHLHDGIAPVLTIYPLQTSPSSATSFSYIALWSKVVTSFNASDIAVGGGSLTSFVGAAGCQAYTVGVTPASDTPITVDVSAGAALDTAGNTNPAASQIVITRDSTPPTVTITPAVALTNVSPLIFTATFSEAIYGLTMSDITAWSGTVDSFTVLSTTSCKFGIIPNTTQGVIQGGILAGHVIDAAGNGNTFGQGGATYDVQRPSVVLTSTAASRSSVTPIVYTATFSESVTGLTESAIQAQVVGGTIVGSSLVGATGTGSSVYTFSVTPSSTWVMVAVQIAASSASDTIGNTNFASNVVTIEHDASLPTLVLSSAAGLASPVVTVNATFSSDVYAFNSSSLVITGGTLIANSFTVLSASSYSAAITPAADPQLVVVSVVAGKALSVANNRPAQAATVNIVHANLPAATATADSYTFAAASAGISSASGILANDVLPSGYTSATLVAAVATSQATTNGGTVTIAANGSFTYVGGTAPDSFTYTLSYNLASPDSSSSTVLHGATSTGTVTITA